MLHPSLVLSSLGTDTTTTSGEEFVEVSKMIESFAGANGTNGSTTAYAEEVLANLGQEEDAECPICFDVMQSPMIIPECLHKWYVLSRSFGTVH